MSTTSAPAACNGHGTQHSSGACICDEGWTTAPNQDPSTKVWCGVEVEAVATFAPDDDGGASNPILNTIFSVYTAYALFFVLIFCCVFFKVKKMCCPHWRICPAWLCPSSCGGSEDDCSDDDSSSSSSSSGPSRSRQAKEARRFKKRLKAMKKQQKREKATWMEEIEDLKKMVKNGTQVDAIQRKESAFDQERKALQKANKKLLKKLKKLQKNPDEKEGEESKKKSKKKKKKKKAEGYVEEVLDKVTGTKEIEITLEK